MNKTNKKGYWLLLIAELLCCTLKAQLSPELVRKYPASVVYRVYGVTQKTNISNEKQLLLAEYFSKQDSLANKALHGGDDILVAMNYYANQDFVKTILSPLEAIDYKFIPSNNTSQFVKALKYRDQLKLNSTQINELLKAITDLEKAQKVSRSLIAENAFNQRQFEGEKLEKVLTTSQYTSFLGIVSKPKIEMDNKEAWGMLKKYNLLDGQDSLKIYNDNLRYFTQADINDSKVNNSQQQEKLDSIRKTYFSFKPLVLLKLDLMTGKLPKSQFLDALKLRKELAITKTQADTLISCISRLEQLKASFTANNPAVRFDGRPFETTHLYTTLNHLQFMRYLMSKHYTQAIVNAKSDWDKLKSYGMTIGIDSAKANKENQKYELNRLVANELYHIDDSPQNGQLKNNIEAKKPTLLKTLDINMKTTASNKNSKKSLNW